MDVDESLTKGVVQRASRTQRAVAWTILGVVVLSVIADLVHVGALGTGRVIVTASGANPRLVLDALPELLQSDARAGAPAVLADAGMGTRILFMVPSLFHAAMIVAATTLLLGALRGIAAGRPFTPSVLARWRQMSLVLLVGGAVQLVLDTIATNHLGTWIGHFYGLDRERAGDVQRIGGDFASVGANAPTIVAGLVALALTAAFLVGARLAEDADGVV